MCIRDSSGVPLGISGATIFGAPHGRALVGLAVVVIALIGLLVSLGIPSRAAADPTRPFPYTGPLDTMKELVGIWKDRQLGRILVADTFLWSVGVFQLLIINTLGLTQFKLNETQTSLLVAAQLVGLAGGGLLAGTLAKGERWFKVLIPSGIVMAAMMLAIGLVPMVHGPWQVPLLYVLIGLAGAAGGLFLIPCESFLQIRPVPERKGAVWASANFASFMGMSVVSLAYTFIPKLNTMLPTRAYAGLGVVSLLFVGWMAMEFRRKEWA